MRFGDGAGVGLTWLIGATGNPAAPAWYIAGTSLITAIAVTLLPESCDRALED